MTQEIANLAQWNPAFDKPRCVLAAEIVKADRGESRLLSGQLPRGSNDLTLEPREDHAAYIANWLDVLTADNRAIFAAARHAQRAADFINGLQPASAG